MQKFKFPMEYLRVTQGENTGSHKGSFAMDFGGKDMGVDKLYCPCDMVVIRRRDRANGELYLESLEPVQFADGTTDYARLLCIHDSKFNVTKGQIVKQGEYFYDEGGMGSGHPAQFANHVHIEAGKGKFASASSARQYKNAFGVYVLPKQAHLNDLFIVGDDVNIMNTGNYKWIRESAIEEKTDEGETENKTIYGVDISHNRSVDILPKLIANGKADFVIPRVAIGSSTEDKNLSRYIQDRGNLKIGFFSANYFYNRQDAIAEADFLIDTIEKYGFTPEKLDLPIFCDWEYFSYNYNKSEGREITPAMLQELTAVYCDRIIERGYKAGVYLNKDYWDNWYGADYFERHPDFKVWYARPGYDSPDKKCDIWQYARNNGADYGVNEDIDKNILMTGYNHEKEPVSPMKPLSDEPVRMYIGYASQGDIAVLQTMIEGLGIACEVKDGYITTDFVSRGDQCYILSECAELGVPCVKYVEPEQPKAEMPTEPPKTPENDDLHLGNESILPEIEKPAEGNTEPPTEDDTTNKKDNWFVRLLKLIVKVFFE